MTVFEGTFEETVSTVTLNPSIDLGSRRTYKGERYVYCYNNSGEAITKEFGVKLVTGCSGYTVAVTSLTDAVHPCVGVAKNTSVSDTGYFWAMTRGFTNLHTSNSILTGDYQVIALAADGGFGRPRIDAQIATAAGCGYALNANTASGGTFYAFINTGF